MVKFDTLIDTLIDTDDDTVFLYFEAKKLSFIL